MLITFFLSQPADGDLISQYSARGLILLFLGEYSTTRCVVDTRLRLIAWEYHVRVREKEGSKILGDWSKVGLSIVSFRLICKYKLSSRVWADRGRMPDDETMTDNVRINGTVNNSLC